MQFAQDMRRAVGMGCETLGQRMKECEEELSVSDIEEDSDASGPKS